MKILSDSWFSFWKNFRMAGLAVLVSVCASFAAHLLLLAIRGTTNLSFYGRWSLEPADPQGHHLGPWVCLVPVAGGLLIGLLARYGSKAIRGHGIPEAMEQILQNHSRISPRVAVLKPLSAAISIGTGGPFGAEGPIIATGGALGSVAGQVLSMTASERRVLLAAGAAAGMTAIFGSPLAAVLLSVELLLFEFSARSLIPVFCAVITAAVFRGLMGEPWTVFPMPALPGPAAPLILFSAVLGLCMGILSVGVTKAVYAIEDGFERLPVHWMWWPAWGGVAVGVIGWLYPQTLGVGYGNIADLLQSGVLWQGALLLAGFKFLSWSIALGSGTSGGTLAPLLTIGGAVGEVLAAAANAWFPGAHIPAGLGALVGMMALFSGASRAMLASMVFGLEVTGQINGLVPLMAGCGVSCWVSGLLMEQSIMTEKISRRGVRTPSHYDADPFRNMRVAEAMETGIRGILPETTVEALAARIAAHDPETALFSTLPLLTGEGILCGMISRGDVLRAIESGRGSITVLEAGSGEPVVVHPGDSLDDAIHQMLKYDLGRLPVMDPRDARRMTGMLTRRSILQVRKRHLEADRDRQPGWFG